MKSLILTTLCGAALVFSACTTTTVTKVADEDLTDSVSAPEARLAEAEEKYGVYYRNHLEEFMAENPSEKKGQTVWLGDSLVERMPEEILFPDGSVINRGVGGDHVAGVRDRLDVSVTQLEPKKVYLMVGMNDILWPRTAMEELYTEYAALLDELKAAAPEARIITYPVLPVGEGREEFLPAIKDFNSMIQSESEKHGFIFAEEVYDHFASEDETIYPDLTSDGVHLSLQGYESLLEYTMYPNQFIDVSIALYREWKTDYQGQHVIQKIDPPLEGEYPGNRGPEELVVYTPAYGADSTGTNEWGGEAVVVDHVVKEQNSKGNSTIPDNGFVISGHGEAMGWIQANMQPGVGVRIDGNLVVLEPAQGLDLSPREKLNAERVVKLQEIVDMQFQGASESEIKKVKDELIEIYKQRRKAQ